MNFLGQEISDEKNICKNFLVRISALQAHIQIPEIHRNPTVSLMTSGDAWLVVSDTSRGLYI